MQSLIIQEEEKQFNDMNYILITHFCIENKGER